jgi:hypothetical protein
VINKPHHEGICCPDFIPAGTLDDFCIPKECCPKILETPKFPSPTSCLPEEQIRELRELIEVVNELLLDLALSNEQPELGRMKAFEGLIGQLVDIKIDCPEAEDNEAQVVNENEGLLIPKKYAYLFEMDLPLDKKERRRVLVLRRRVLRWIRRMEKKVQRSRTRRKEAINEQAVSHLSNGEISGRVHAVGRNFILLRNNKEEIIIPLLKITLIKPQNRFAQPTKGPDLTEIDPCLRRALTFNFGETVASSPELIDIFFKMTLPIFLLTHIDKPVIIKTADEKLEGTLICVNQESLTISNGNMRDIPFESICFIKI